jgi:hypothetical protein
LFGGGFREFVYDMDGPVFLKRELYYYKRRTCKGEMIKRNVTKGIRGDTYLTHVCRYHSSFEN